MTTKTRLAALESRYGSEKFRTVIMHYGENEAAAIAAHCEAYGLTAEQRASATWICVIRFADATSVDG